MLSTKSNFSTNQRKNLRFLFRRRRQMSMNWNRSIDRFLLLCAFRPFQQKTLRIAPLHLHSLCLTHSHTHALLRNVSLSFHFHKPFSLILSLSLFHSLKRIFPLLVTLSSFFEKPFILPRNWGRVPHPRNAVFPPPTSPTPLPLVHFFPAWWVQLNNNNWHQLEMKMRKNKKSCRCR